VIPLVKFDGHDAHTFLRLVMPVAFRVICASVLVSLDALSELIRRSLRTWFQLFVRAGWHCHRMTEGFGQDDGWSRATNRGQSPRRRDLHVALARSKSLRVEKQRLCQGPLALAAAPRKTKRVNWHAILSSRVQALAVLRDGRSIHLIDRRTCGVLRRGKHPLTLQRQLRVDGERRSRGSILRRKDYRGLCCTAGFEMSGCLGREST
jgi:hypothetical protein